MPRILIWPEPPVLDTPKPKMLRSVTNRLGTRPDITESSSGEPLLSSSARVTTLTV